MFKNVAAKFIVFAFDATTNVPKTGDAANITAYVSKDYGTVTVLGDTSATEMDATNAPGYYLFDAAQAETNADVLMVSAKSGTANIKVIGAPAVIYTRPTTGWLAPTTAARTLDVSAGGEAGVDWSNVGSPTTALALTGTTIAVTQKVDVDTIKTNPVVNAGTITFPTTATLASTTNITAGTIATVTAVTTVNGLAAGVITATSIAADAITAAKIADGAIDAATFAASAITATVLAADCITAAKVADGTIDAATFAAGAINRASLAADTGLQPIRSNTAQAGAGTTITLDASASAVDNFYINDIILLTGGTGAGQARFISGYVGATKVATVATWATNPDNTSTFAILPFDAIAGASAPTAAQVATAVWQDTTAGDFSTAGSIGKSLFTSGAVPGASGGLFIAGSNAATTVNVTGNLTGNVTGSVGSVTGAVGSVTGAVGSVTGAVASVTGNVGGNVTGTVGSVVGAVGSVTGNVGGNVTGSVGSLAAQAKADVNAEALDVLNTDTYAEPAQGAPAATTTLAAKVNYLYKAWRNKSAQTATTYSLYNDDAATVDHKATVSDDNTTFVKGEVATGP